MSDAGATLLLVRHGQIAANVSRIWHGSTDSELTERGHEEARRTAVGTLPKRLRFRGAGDAHRRRCRPLLEQFGHADAEGVRDTHEGRDGGVRASLLDLDEDPLADAGARGERILAPAARRAHGAHLPPDHAPHVA